MRCITCKDVWAAQILFKATGEIVNRREVGTTAKQIYKTIYSIYGDSVEIIRVKKGWE